MNGLIKVGLQTFCLSLCVSLLTAPAANARLGEDFEAYRTRALKAFKPAGQNKSGANTNFLYQMQTNPAQEQACPGYAVGLTVTVANNKITGQSLAVRPGSNMDTGTTMAILNGFAFAYEAIGKPLPTQKAQTDVELKSFSRAVRQAFAWQPQNIRYPGFPGLITVSLDSTGNLIIAARP